MINVGRGYLLPMIEENRSEQKRTFEWSEPKNKGAARGRRRRRCKPRPDSKQDKTPEVEP
jgi:hypothetical protein